MKRLFTLLLLTCFAFVANAQVGTLISTTNSKALDTVTNTATKYVGIQINGAAEQLSFVATVTKLTGTVGGTVSLLGSIDGTNFGKADTTTYTPTDVAGGQSFSWYMTPSRFIYYRVSYTGAASSTATIQAKSLTRK